jgi:hypothetical protein
MADLTLVSYCGLYCGLCAHRGRIRQRARELRESLYREQRDPSGAAIPKEFQSLLCSLADSKTRCSCRQGTCGPPLCGIRRCAQQRGVALCPFCDEYPCDRILERSKSSSSMLANGMRMKAVGIEAWIREQE